MKNSIKIAFVAVIGIAGIAACTSAPEQHNAVSVPTTQTPTSAPSSVPSDPSAPPVVTEVVTETVTNQPKPQAVTKVDNRIGYGALKLGMTLEEARAAGLTNATYGTTPDCASDGTVAVSKKYGVIRITLPKDAKTSAGIGVGSDYAAVKKAYPKATEYRGGYEVSLGDYWYDFEGISSTRYFKDTDKVLTIELVSSNAGESECHMLQI